MEDTKRGRGRPALPDDERRGEMVKVRVNAYELERLKAGAEARGESVSDLVRRSALRIADRAIKGD